jgi:dTDP-4-dehydrorhamnose reductase
MNNDTDTTVSSPFASDAQETLMNATVQNEIADLVENRLANGERVTLLHLSKEKQISPNEIRNALVEAFGNRVQFKRGRTGGIILAAA